ncbi:disks large homolog 5a isoform X10 [Heterodontus francisci]|uniref:disks large homolog 5a isoform X10 n=1 Tax=Heterodontus francisci TaxID=7792 RepID=UPI00355B3EC9
MAEDCVGSTYSVLSTMPSDSESSSSLSSIGTGTSGKAASPPPMLMDTRQMSEKLEAIVFQLRQVTRERDELRKQLALSSPGSTFDDCRPSPKPSHDYERLKMQCMKAMSDLQSLQNQHTKTLKKCEEAVKEADFYHTLHSRLRNDQSQLKEEMEVIKRENTQLLREHNHVQQTCEELKRLHEDDQKEITDLRSQQQQVMRENGSSEILNKLYDTAMDKLEGLKKDYDALRKRYNEKIANHNTDLSRLERVEEENRRFQKQNEMLMKQRDAAVVEKTSIQQQYLSTLKRYDSIQHELSKATVQNKEIQREMERLQTEVTRYKTLQLKAVKDAEKYKEERDTVLNEYRLVMSERDQVHKEIDKLQTELELAQGHLKNTSSERKVAGEELEALRQELHSALVERDHAICERNELLEKYCHEVKDKAEAQKELDQACKDIETVKEERDVARKERTEAIIQRDQLLREYYQARQCLNLQKQDSATLDMERANKEIEMLRKQCEAMSQELKEGIQEAEVAKRRRDWAFQERDKIVAERESIRTLCDNLRRERDRAVSDLAEALRDLDDMMKQKNDAIRELKELKEKMENQLEKEARIRQLMAHNSHDSAIDTDSLEWETEVVEFAKDRDDMDLKALGFDVAGGADEPYLPGDSGIFVIKVDKGSIADGRLRVNDCLLRINDVDLTNKDRKHVIKAVLNGGGVINMVVRRRKSLGGRAITPVHINLVGHKDIGISLETGVYVASVAPGSSAAREGSLTVGDRLITINGIALENKSLAECEALLRNCRDSVSLSLMKENVDSHSHYDSHATCSPILKYNTSEERLCLELHEWHRYTPKRSHRHSAGYVSTMYNGPASAGSVQRSFVPCPAVTAVLRNPNVPFFTVRSRMVHSANYPSMASQMCYPHPQHSRTRNHSPTESINGSPRTRHRPQSAICFPESVHPFDSFSPHHHTHHSLDLTGPDHKHSSDLSESSRSTTPHGTQSLPASARIAGSSSSLAFAPSKSGRIRIPSNPRYSRLTTGSDRGSERSSPSLITPPQSPMNLETSSFGSSQSQSSISSLTKISISPVSTGEHRKDRPYLQEPRHVTVQKGTEPLGISIVSGENGGIFVSKVIGGSIAHQAGLEYGDQLLEYNGINLRNATEQQARLIIGQTEPCETITILAQYNPHMYQLGNHSRSSSRLEPISNHSTPQGSEATTPDNHSIIDAVSEQDEGTITPPSKQTTPTTSPRNSIRKSIDSPNQIAEPRFLFLKKTQMELGIQISGGNLYGVFVAKVEDDSPANIPDGLVPGDKLLEYNGTDMRNVTAEQAYVEMLKPTEAISVKAQYRIEEFNKIRHEAGDGFYIRALYDRVAEVEHDLSFKKDDILYVDDTLPQGNFGYWMAWQLDENAQKLERGQIPSKYMMDQEFCRRHSMSEVKDENGSVKTLSAAARRSFFRRKQKHKRNNSKDGKEMLALDAISTDSIPLLEDCGSLAYQRVQKIECTSPRPVLILGPLVDAVKDMLVKDSSGKFCRCPLEVMKASQQAIERGVADYLFIDYKRRSGHFDVTTVASIKEITEKDCHCLLDIAPHAIERLHRIHIYPIVIFIRYKNLKQIKEQKDPTFLRDKGTQKKHSKEQFEAAQKIEQEYSKFFTGIVQGGSLPFICTQIMTIVDQEQNKVLWIPAGTL